MRFRDIHNTPTFKKFDGNVIKIDGILYDIDIFPFNPEEGESTRMWVRARRIMDCKLYATEKDMYGFSYDNPKVEKVLFEIKKRIFEDLVKLGYIKPVEEFNNIFEKDNIYVGNLD